MYMKQGQILQIRENMLNAEKEINELISLLNDITNCK